MANPSDFTNAGFRNRDGSVAPRTFLDKVWDAHVISALGENTFLLQIDRLFLHELGAAPSLGKLEKAGRAVDSPDQIFGTIDHIVSTMPGRLPSDVRHPDGERYVVQTRELTARAGITLFDTSDRRQGIVHVVSPELGIALPGSSLVCCDSHTCTVGAIGALAWGIGVTECEHVLATQALTQTKPLSMRITFEGELASGVTPKDLILFLIGKIGANGGIGYAVEFAGPIIRNMPVEGRFTVCNMAVEFQAKYAFIAPDELTFAYLKGKEFAPRGAMWDEAVEHWRTLATDAGAVFDREIVIDCTEIQPQVTWGTSPQQVVGIAGRIPFPDDLPDPGARQLLESALNYIQLAPGQRMEGVAIEAAFIGSCTNARLSDLRAAARVLAGRRVASGVLAICTPGSTSVKHAAEAEGLDRIFLDAGFEWHESGCGLCGTAGDLGFPDMRVISTTNRNFEGRQGKGARTHLASPETVAASAVAGKIVAAASLAGE